MVSLFYANKTLQKITRNDYAIKKHMFADLTINGQIDKRLLNKLQNLVAKQFF